MLEIIQEYWQNYLFTDGYRITGLAITMWLLVVSIGLGFCLSIPLAVARVSKNRFLSRSVWLYTYVFRGTPLYVQLLLCYTGLYSLQVVRDHMLLDQFFRNGMNCTLLAFTLNTCAYTTEIFAGAIKATPYGEIEAARAYGMSSVHAVSAGDPAVGAAARAAVLQQRSDPDAARHDASPSPRRCRTFSRSPAT